MIIFVKEWIIFMIWFNNKNFELLNPKLVLKMQKGCLKRYNANDIIPA